MIRKKICMLGTSAVGKTSLVEKYVRGIFSDKYLTTVGVKISKKAVQVGNVEIELLLWDLNGEDRFQKLSSSYLRGTSAYLLVIDGTRRETAVTAADLHERAQAEVGLVPFLTLLNKSDLHDEWDIEDGDIPLPLRESGDLITTSAKSGTGVEEAFRTLAQMTLSRD